MRNITPLIESSYLAKKRLKKGILRFSSTQLGFQVLQKVFSFRLLSLIDSSLRSGAIATISGYQRHISPRKGYSCAHRLVHGGDSCSQYVKKMLADKSLFEATLLARTRFKECNIAYLSSKDRIVEYKDSVMVSVGPDDLITLIIGIIISIVSAIVGFICGGGNSPCKK